MRSSRAIAAIAVAVATATAAAACSSGGSSSTSTSTGSTSSSSSAAKVTLSWWNNANTQPLLGVFQTIIKSFEAAHPNITIQNVPMQNELFKTKITPALRGNSPPDIFQQWGSGQQATQVQSGKLADISSQVSSWISSLGTPATAWQTNGKWYGVPYDLHVVGFWYRKDLFQQAGIKTTPTTIPELESDDAALRAHGITPITVGSKDGWPDAFWWEYFAVRECSQSTVTQAMSSVSLSAPCFTKASADLNSFMKTNPFQTGFLAPRRSRSRTARWRCSPTARPPWSCKATGTPPPVPASPPTRTCSLSSAGSPSRPSRAVPGTRRPCSAGVTVTPARPPRRSRPAPSSC